MFAGDLCLALGRTLAEVLAMSAAEFAFWSVYHRRRGFPFERQEAATAIAGAAMVRRWGSQAEPKDLLPRFGPRQVDNRVLAARLAALPGAKVRRIPRPERKAAKLAQEAEQQKADGARDQREQPRSRILNPKR